MNNVRATFIEVHTETADARAFLTAIIHREQQCYRDIDARTPNLEHQLSLIWGEFIGFIRSEYGEEDAENLWRDFCEFGTATAELEIFDES